MGACRSCYKCLSNKNTLVPYSWPDPAPGVGHPGGGGGLPLLARGGEEDGLGGGPPYWWVRGEGYFYLFFI